MNLNTPSWLFFIPIFSFYFVLATAHTSALPRACRQYCLVAVALYKKKIVLKNELEYTHLAIFYSYFSLLLRSLFIYTLFHLCTNNNAPVAHGHFGCLHRYLYNQTQRGTMALYLVRSCNR